VWDARTGQALVGPIRHRDDVPHAFFSPDGRMLLTVSSDHTARVWEVETGEPITPPLAHDGPVLFVAWSPHGRSGVSCGRECTRRVWDISPVAESITRLKRQAELLSAHRLEADLGSVPLTAAEMKDRWDSEFRRPSFRQ